MTLAPASPACLPVSPSSRLSPPDAVTLAPNSLVSLCLPFLLSEARCCDAGSGVVSPVSQSAGSDAML